MKVVIPSYQRPDFLTTPYLDVFKNFDKYILVHDKQELSDYKKHNPNLNIICTDIDVALGGGLPRQRKWAIDNLVEHNEWIVFADDNIKEIHGITNNTWHQDEITQPNADDWSNVSDLQFVERINYLTNYADANNAYHIGFLPAHNYYFARRKVKHYGFCMGKMTLWKKDNNFAWNNFYFNAVEDFNHTAMHLVNYGIVIVHDYMYPHAYHYQRGGIGNKKNRKQERIDNIKFLTSYYPELIKTKKRKDNYPDARIVYMSKKNFIIWRNKYKEFVKNYTYDIDKYKWLPNDMS